MNEVVIYDESVSRHHAEITYHNNEFYLKDIGSTTGTYIKITEKIDLELDMIIEIGSYQFQVTNINISYNTDGFEDLGKSTITLEIYDGPEDFEKAKAVIEDKGTIGRKQTNIIHFVDDLHMSNLHCTISLMGPKFVLEDMGSTNGYVFIFIVELG